MTRQSDKITDTILQFISANYCMFSQTEPCNCYAIIEELSRLGVLYG